jgi:hypothetical protein
MAVAMTWSSSCQATKLTATTISPSAGERCTGITVPTGLEQPRDGIPSVAIIIIIPRRTI